MTTISRHNLTPTSDQTPVIVEVSTKRLSGASWVSEFPTSTHLEDLAEPFATRTAAFITALQDAGATVEIAATLRPAQRAFLMHWAWKIVNQDHDPQHVPEHRDVDIEWAHTDATGVYCRETSVAAAKAMVSAYGIQNLKVAPSLSSRHIEGDAIDMTISWVDSLTLRDASGKSVSLYTLPRTGMNTELHAVGASYGVVKFKGGAADKPHWSRDGR